MRKNPSTTRRTFLKETALLTTAASHLMAANLLLGSTSKRIPVILATDIGDDIDDSWALGLLLKSPQLDLKLAVTEYGKAAYRAKLLAKFLQSVGRTDIPVGVGPDLEPRGDGPLAPWVADYDLASYPGKVLADGVQAIIDTIMHSKEQVTVICIGPMPNVAAALAKEPAIARRARFVGMDGSIRVGYGGSKKPAAEWNVRAAPQAAQKVLSAAWDITITPLDTCGLVGLDGARYRRLLNARDPVAATVIENYRIWSRSNKTAADAENHSSTLFDTVAVYLAFAQDFCRMESLGVRVTDDGFTVVDEHGKQMRVATEWKSLDGFKDLLVGRLVDAGAQK